MSLPLLGPIKTISSGTAGTGAFTPSTALSGYLDWATEPAGWFGTVRFEDGASWEITPCYWNGTTLARGAAPIASSAVFFAQLSLSSSATAQMVIEPTDVIDHLGGSHTIVWSAANNSTTLLNVGSAPTVGGTPSNNAIATTNMLTEQQRLRVTSATTANAQAPVTRGAVDAVVSTSSGRGGYCFKARFGASQIPTGPRLFAGLTSVTMVGVTGEPSAQTAHIAAFAKDSTDSNIQFIANSNAGACTKTDTGIALAANGVYDCLIYTARGSTTIFARLFRLDNGGVWSGYISSDVPANGATLMKQIIGGLSSTTGTAFQLEFINSSLRTGP